MNCQVAVLPWGATEAHNYHLPYGTDVYQAEAIAIEAARLSWENGRRVTVLPAIPFGVNTGQLDIPLTINLNPSTQLLILRDVADSLLSCGIGRLVLLNGHGGNDFRPAVRELLRTHPLLIIAVNWWQIDAGTDYVSEPGDHAGALETSLMMHLEPELVLPLAAAGKGAARAPRITALREGWAWTPRRWTQATRDTGVGDPSGASAPAGERYLQSITARLSQLLVELADCPRDQLYSDAETGDQR
jgi:creatinine amidohydrolase